MAPGEEKKTPSVGFADTSPVRTGEEAKNRKDWAMNDNAVGKKAQAVHRNQARTRPGMDEMGKEAAGGEAREDMLCRGLSKHGTQQEIARTREHTRRVSLFELAIKGMDIDAVGQRDIKALIVGALSTGKDQHECDRLGIQLTMRLCRGVDVIRAIDAQGEDRGVRSIKDAKCLRITLAYCIGLLDELVAHGFARRMNFSKTELAEVICEIRSATGELHPEWK